MMMIQSRQQIQNIIFLASKFYATVWEDDSVVEKIRESFLLLHLKFRTCVEKSRRHFELCALRWQAEETILYYRYFRTCVEKRRRHFELCVDKQEKQKASVVSLFCSMMSPRRGLLLAYKENLWYERSKQVMGKIQYEWHSIPDHSYQMDDVIYVPGF